MVLNVMSVLIVFQSAVPVQLYTLLELKKAQPEHYVPSITVSAPQPAGCGMYKTMRVHILAPNLSSTCFDTRPQPPPHLLTFLLLCSGPSARLVPLVQSICIK